MTDVVHNIIILGSGPAGYTAALYAARANLSPLLVEGTEFGGALMTTTEVENFPGFPDGITGPELMDGMRKQAEHFGAQLLTADADKVSLGTRTDDIKTVWVGQTAYRARAVIVAMGSAWRRLGVPGESELLGRGVSSCATCDGFFFRDQDIAVIGGGDSAMEEATFLTRFARSVTIVHRRGEFRASQIMQQRALDNPKITVSWNSAVSEIVAGPNGKVCGVRIIHRDTGDEQTLDVTGVFVAIGHVPRSELVTGQIELDESGYILTEAPSSHTNVPGVFAAGDVVDHTYQQAVTAAASGCIAALDAQRYLASQ
ncbi:MAG: thioredoxin-disulfide reductase [Mycobacteriales bacterium]